jgi:bifunctional non-homologous end joining protein LigD
MAATLVATLPAGDEWLYEAKFDGYRALALKDGASIRILSRKNNDLTTAFPHVAAAMATLPAKQILLDGEIVAFDSESHDGSGTSERSLQVVDSTWRPQRVPRKGAT